MDKVSKFLRRLSKKETEALELLLFQIGTDFKKVPGIKKLQGSKSLFRVRFSKYRIIFLVRSDKSIEIKKISRMDGNTYKNL